MYKKIVGIVAASAFALPLLAFASVNFDTLNGVTFNGKASLSGVDAVQPGASIDIKSLINSTGGSDFNSMSADWIGDFLPPVCVSFPEQSQSGTYFESISLPAAQSAGLWDLQLKLYGVNGAGQDFNCSSTNLVDTANFNGRVAVADNTTLVSNASNSSSSSSVGSVAWFQVQIAALTAAIAALQHPTPPVSNSSAVCTAYAQAAAGAVQGVTSQANVRLQGFLLSQNASIPALAAGASFGFWGPQTAAAVSWFKSLNSCQ